MRFLFFIVLSWTVIFCLHLLSYVSIAPAFGIELPYWPLVLALLAGSYFIAGTLMRKLGGKFFNLLYVLSATWMGVILLIFSFQLPHIFFQIFTGESSAVVAGTLLLLSIVTIGYALFNGRRLTTKEYTISIQNLKKDIRVVHLTDIHIGTVHQTKFLAEVVNITNSLNPELVLITGDLFDGSVPIDEEILAPLNTLLAPAFFSNGNHEEYEGLQYVRDTISHIDIELLENRSVVYEGIQIVGVNDRQSLKKHETLGGILDGLSLNKELPTILMYHTPVEWDTAREKGVDLMLSGHTHNGQIYPFTLLVRMFFKYIMGLYQEDDKYLHVSPGTGTWGPPMRLGSKNQITILTLVPTQE